MRSRMLWRTTVLAAGCLAACLLVGCSRSKDRAEETGHKVANEAASAAAASTRAQAGTIRADSAAISRRLEQIDERREAGAAQTAEAVALLSSPEVGTRIQAAWALGCLGQKADSAMEALVRATQDPVIHVRAHACWALPQVAPQREAVRMRLAEMASHDADVSARHAAAGDEEESVQAAIQAASIGPSLKEASHYLACALVPVLTSESQALQAERMKALGDLGADGSAALRWLRLYLIDAPRGEDADSGAAVAAAPSAGIEAIERIRGGTSPGGRPAAP